MLDLVIHKFADWGKNEIFILREDLLPIACGGNKVRIALRLIEDARRRGADTIVAYGNSRSNLCRVMAMLCASEKLKCVVVSPSDDDGQSIETTNSRIVRRCGARVVKCLKTDSIPDIVVKVENEIRESGGRPYYIFGNRLGKGNEGVLRAAYEEVACKILQWSEQRNIFFNRVALAVGTGATYAGLLNGFRANGSCMPVTGYTIARSKERCVNCIRDFTAYPADISAAALLEGYGKTSPELLEFLSQMMLERMIVFDSTYAGKALWGLRKDADASVMRNEKILFVHTGSMPLAIDTIAHMVEVMPLYDVGQFPLEQYEHLASLMPKFSLRGEELLAYLNKLVQFGQVYILKKDETMLGLIGFYANDAVTRKAYLSMLSVDSSLQGTGYAKKLLDTMREVAVNAGMIQLDANVVKDNARAIRFYEKNGLCIVSEGQDENHFLISGRLQ